MKTSCILYLVAVLGPFVHARVYSDTYRSSVHDVTTECRYEATPGITILQTLRNKQAECARILAVVTRALTATSKHAMRSTFQSACAHEASVRACMADVGVAALSCLDALEMKLFTTRRNFAETAITAACADRSEAVTTMYADVLQPLMRSQMRSLMSCRRSVTAGNIMIDAKMDPVVAFTMRRYTGMKNGRDCVVSLAREANLYTSEAFEVMNKIIDGSKCITADTYEIVLCSTIDSTVSKVPAK